MPDKVISIYLSMYIVYTWAFILYILRHLYCIYLGIYIVYTWAVVRRYLGGSQAVQEHPKRSTLVIHFVVSCASYKQNMDVFVVRKYHTCSKKLLQTKNRFQSFRRRFLYVTDVADTVFFVKKGFLAIQMEYFWKSKKPFCFAKRLLLQCK